jgi:hypothetical protein
MGFPTHRRRFFIKKKEAQKKKKKERKRGEVFGNIPDAEILSVAMAT